MQCEVRASFFFDEDRARTSSLPRAPPATMAEDILEKQCERYKDLYLLAFNPDVHCRGSDSDVLVPARRDRIRSLGVPKLTALLDGAVKAGEDKPVLELPGTHRAVKYFVQWMYDEDSYDMLEGYIECDIVELASGELAYGEDREDSDILEVLALFSALELSPEQIRRCATSRSTALLTSRTSTGSTT